VNAKSTSTGLPSAAASPLGPLAQLSAGAIAKQAVVDTTAASVIHLTGLGVATSHSMQVAVDLQVIPAKGCTGTFTVLGSNAPEELLVIGSNIWVKPSAAYWKHWNIPTDFVQKVSGKYLQDTMPGNGDATAAVLCDVRSLMGTWSGSDSDIAKGAITTLGGQQVLALQTSYGTVEVTNSVRPKIVQIAMNQAGGSAIKFNSETDPTLVLNPPPTSETLDGSQFGF
jgi:hypothetical protein